MKVITESKISALVGVVNKAARLCCVLRADLSKAKRPAKVIEKPRLTHEFLFV